MEACLVQFQTFADQNAAKTGIDEGIRKQAKATVIQTYQTLEELHQKIGRFLPEGRRPLARATMWIAARYFWSETTLRAMVTRLRMHREAIAIIMNLWCT